MDLVRQQMLSENYSLAVQTMKKVNNRGRKRHPQARDDLFLVKNSNYDHRLTNGDERVSR